MERDLSEEDDVDFTHPKPKSPKSTAKRQKKSFKCLFGCGVVCGTLAEIQQHQDEKHPIEPKICEYCNESFKRQRFLDAHLALDCKSIPEEKRPKYKPPVAPSRQQSRKFHFIRTNTKNKD